MPGLLPLIAEAFLDGIKLSLKSLCPDLQLLLAENGSNARIRRGFRSGLNHPGKPVAKNMFRHPRPPKPFPPPLIFRPVITLREAPAQFPAPLPVIGPIPMGPIPFPRGIVLPSYVAAKRRLVYSVLE